MGVSSFEELRAWQLAAACSAPSLIAEGFGRFGFKEFRRYLAMARGELLEVQNHLVDLEKRGWCTAAEIAALRDLTDHAVRVTALLRSSIDQR